MEDSYVLQITDRKFTDLYLCFCGYAKCEPLHSFGPAVRPNYILHYILEGKGKYYVGNTQYELEAGQGFLIEPEVQTFYQADQAEPWTYLWIGFDGTHAKEYLKDIGLNHHQPIYRCSQASELKSIVVNMLKNHTSTVTNQLLLESLLYSFFAILSKDIALSLPSEQEETNRYIRQAIEYIQNNYSYHIHITDIADYVCINRSYLYSLFQRNLHISPQQYLTNYRITRATELLTTTDLSIEGVALSCGYRDPFVFAKAFKSQKGIPPSQYRKNELQKNKTYLKQKETFLEKL